MKANQSTLIRKKKPVPFIIGITPEFIFVIFIFLICTFSTSAQTFKFLATPELISIYNSIMNENTDNASKDENEMIFFPFDTEWIATELHIKESTVDDFSQEDMFIIEMSEEQEVNDIPFDTKKVFYSILLDNNEYSMPDEAEVDDIPFDTKKVYFAIFHDSMMFFFEFGFKVNIKIIFSKSLL